MMADTPEPTSPAPAEKAVRPFRVLLGAALQKHRLRRGPTQAQLAAFADLSLKYVGEIERGEANTTLDAIERVTDACGWNPLDAWDLREPLTEGVRVLLIGESQEMCDRLRSMVRRLRAIDPALHASARPAIPTPPTKRQRARARPSQPRK